MMFLLLTLALITFTNAQFLPIDLSLSGAARSQLAGVLTADGKVFFAGGLGGVLTTLYNAVDIIVTADNAVSAGLRPLSSSRFALSAATSANFSIFAGGLTAATSYSADVDIYDATTGTWNTSTLAVARARHAIGITASHLYVAGGEVAADTYTDSVEVFVSATGEIDAALNFTLSIPRAFIASATLDTSVYFAGGLYFNGSADVTAVVDVYNTADDTLSTVELSAARQQIAAISVGDQVFFAGGASATGVASAVVDIWNATSANFTVTALSVARWGVRVAVVGDLILFHGGYTAANVASAVVDIYNVATQTWEQATALSRARADFATVVADNKVYIAGGVSGGITALISGAGSLEVLDFNPQPNNTETPTPTPNEIVNLTVTVVQFPTARAQLAATVSGTGQLLIAGGLGASLSGAISSIDVSSPADAVDLSAVLGVPRLGLEAQTSANISVFAGGALLSLLPQANVDIYDAANASWSTANLQTARVFHASATVGTKIYVAGGQSTLLAFTDTIEVYDTETGVWTTLNVTLSVPRGYLTAAVVGTKIVFAGGRSGVVATATLSAVVDVLDTVTLTVSSGVLSVARAELAASVVGDLILFGGGVEAGATASVVVDVWNSTSETFLAQTEALSVGRWALQAVTVGTDVLFVGGFDGTDAYATVDIWSSVDLTWSVKYLTYPRYNFAATVDVSGTAYFCGGQNSLGFLASVEIYAGESTVTPTPTPEVTPSPTPVVTPTPTPGGVTPTPTPNAADCVTPCTGPFEAAQTSWNPAVNVDFTTRCAAWATLLTCLEACTTDTTNALQIQTDACQQDSTGVNNFCACGRTPFAFNADAAVDFVAANRDVFVTRFNGLSGVLATPASGATTSLTADVDANTLQNSFTYDDSVQVDVPPVSVTVDIIAALWAQDLATYFNTSPLNFVVSQGKKRAEQTATLSVNVADNTGSSGVAQLSVSFAFLLVTFLLHVLF